MAVKIAESLEQDGNRVFRVNLGAGRAGVIRLPLLYLHFLWTALRADIVQVISASGSALWAKDLPALLFARLFGKTTILMFVGGAATETAPSWGWWKRLPFRVAHRVVVPTEVFRNSLIEGGLRARFEVIPHVVDIEPFSMVEGVRDAPILLGIKGLEPHAGFDLLIDVLSRVRDRIHDAELWIVGEGPARSQLEDLVRKENIQGVRFSGSVPQNEVRSLMARASIFVHGTRFESFGIALVEAMAAGLPVVAFSIGGIPEVVIDGETGFLVTYGDRVTFSERVVSLLAGRSMREEMGQSGREWSERFGWGKIGPRWYELYRLATTSD